MTVAKPITKEEINKTKYGFKRMKRELKWIEINGIFVAFFKRTIKEV